MEKIRNGLKQHSSGSISYSQSVTCLHEIDKQYASKWQRLYVKEGNEILPKWLAEGNFGAGIWVSAPGESSYFGADSGKKRIEFRLKPGAWFTKLDKPSFERLQKAYSDWLSIQPAEAPNGFASIQDRKGKKLMDKLGTLPKHCERSTIPRERELS